ncbi:MAG: NADH-quinone oxidoreductase subunit C [Gammaproteobacteria bacterium]|nr:NADH-quinone oxidoreductase subunit C [Gammaproteobacteria bacterium]
MANMEQALLKRLNDDFADVIESVIHGVGGEVTVVVRVDAIKALCFELRDRDAYSFEQLIDLCAVDYLEYAGEKCDPAKRFAVVYHLLSVKHNQRLRIKAYVAEDNTAIDSVIDVWRCADWYEREAYDLYGVLFYGHPDLRRLLTDYGFIGHPFRKDFPISGHVEMRYDPEKKRVVYEPVSIEPRVLVPRKYREDNRYLGKGEINNG